MSSKSKKILGLITIVVLLLICIGGSETSAVSNIPQITVSNTSANRVNSNTAASGINITIGDTTRDESTSKNNTVKNNAVKNSATTKNNAVNKNISSSYKNTNRNTSSLPYTGTSDSVLFIVAALLVSAIYAYKKIRDYNV